jgi:hypothetical protein
MKKILVYGNSLWFDGLTSSLPETQALQVMRADPAQLQQFANAADIDLVLMDTAVANLNLLTLLHTFPTAVLLVIDLTTDRLTVLQGQSFVMSTMQEVVQLIRGLTAAHTRLVLAPAGTTAPV